MSRASSLLIAAAAGCGPPSASEGGAADAIAVLQGELSWQIPVDVDRTGPPSLQRKFEDFAWQSFVALNWPATTNGSPDSTAVVGQNGDAVTVWEFYKSVGDVFLPGGNPPGPWNSPPVVPAVCRRTGSDALPVLQTTTPPEAVVAQFTLPFQDGPVIDQKDAFVRFGIRMNRVAFDYVVNNRLYRVDGQETLGVVDMPSGGSGSVGSITLKSAWKILGSEDSPERFHTMEAFVYTPASTSPPITEDCTREQLGLVGFHITQKTPSEPKWIWATFEQVDNLTVLPGSGLTPSFNDPACDSCSTNVPTTQPWDPTRPGIPTQLVREAAIRQETDSVNAAWQARLRAVSDASPWQYYEVVGVQRPTQPDNPQESPGDPTPVILANSIIEAFVQGSSTCMGCHIGARSGDGEYFSDYSYLFTHADPSTASPGGS